MSNAQISVPLSKEQAYALVDAVMEREDLALSATAREGENGQWVFEAMCDEEPDIEVFNKLAEEAVGGRLAFTIEPVDEQIDWVARSLEGLQPVIAGGFYVFGGHSAGSAPGGYTPLHIEAAQAFGTGHHQTTTGCLEAIHAVLKRSRPEAMLDVGTGTGVLAIALAKRRRMPVIASDIDPVSVSTTRDNARLNGVTNNIIAVEAAGLDHRVIADNAPYDMIVANILAGPLKDLAPAIGAAAQPGAAVILSGILHYQAARVIAAYAQQDIILERRIQRGEWTTLLLRRASGQSSNRGC